MTLFHATDSMNWWFNGRLHINIWFAKACCTRTTISSDSSVTVVWTIASKMKLWLIGWWSNTKQMASMPMLLKSGGYMTSRMMMIIKAILENWIIHFQNHETFAIWADVTISVRKNPSTEWLRSRVVMSRHLAQGWYAIRSNYSCHRKTGKTSPEPVQCSNICKQQSWVDESKCTLPKN